MPTDPTNPPSPLPSPAPAHPEHHITQLLQAAGDGDSQAARDLLPLVYQRLRELAAAKLRHVPPGQTLQPTALVHEAYLKLVGEDDPGWQSRNQFFFAAARAMHNILVDQARRKASVKHGGPPAARRRVDVANLSAAIDAPADDMLALSEALQQLEQSKPRLHQLVMLRFFAGMSIPEAAEVMSIGESTAKRDWFEARMTLHRHLKDDEGLSDG